MLQVIDSARNDLFLVSYVFYKASSIVAALDAAVARGVAVSILLESSTCHVGTFRADNQSKCCFRLSIPLETISSSLATCFTRHLPSWPLLMRRSLVASP